MADLTVSLSEYDRGVCKIMCDAVPWAGGEEGMAARLSLEHVLKIGDLNSRGDNFPIEKLDRKAVPYKITPLAVELLVAILCGGGGAPSPAIGRVAASVVARIRKQAPKPKAA